MKRPSPQGCPSTGEARPAGLGPPPHLAVCRHVVGSACVGGSRISQTMVLSYMLLHAPMLGTHMSLRNASVRLQHGSPGLLAAPAASAPPVPAPSGDRRINRPGRTCGPPVSGGLNRHGPLSTWLPGQDASVKYPSRRKCTRRHFQAARKGTKQVIASEVTRYIARLQVEIA